MPSPRGQVTNVLHSDGRGSPASGARGGKPRAAAFIRLLFGLQMVDQGRPARRQDLQAV